MKNKPLVISAISIGILSTLWALITWLPLALGYQTCEYSEPSQLIAIFEFSCIAIGLVYLVYVLIRYARAR